jgi:hypothetical protein
VRVTLMRLKQNLEKMCGIRRETRSHAANAKIK